MNEQQQWDLDCLLADCTCEPADLHTEAEHQQAETVGFQLSFPRLHLWNLPVLYVNQRRRAATVGSQTCSPRLHPRTRAMWDTAVFSTPAPEELADPAQQRRRNGNSGISMFC